MDDSRCRGKKRIGRNENILALNAQDAKNNLPGACAAIYRDGMLTSTEPGKLLFKLCSVLTQGELSRG
jgi:hypothetical protein